MRVPLWKWNIHKTFTQTAPSLISFRSFAGVRCPLKAKMVGAIGIPAWRWLNPAARQETLLFFSFTRCFNKSTFLKGPSSKRSCIWTWCKWSPANKKPPLSAFSNQNNRLISKISCAPAPSNLAWCSHTAWKLEWQLSAWNGLKSFSWKKPWW